MSLIKYFERVVLIHRSIENEKTGTSKEFAQRIGISRSLLMEHIRELRENFNAPIDFCRRRQTFYYVTEFKLKSLMQDELKSIKGGNVFSIEEVQSNVIGLSKLNLAWLAGKYQSSELAENRKSRH